jgi:hypothetical protein
MLVQELKAAMPDKLVTFYYYGPATTRQSYNGDQAGNYIDYSWNAMYGTYSAPNVPPLTKTKLSAAATWIQNSNSGQLRPLHFPALLPVPKMTGMEYSCGMTLAEPMLRIT